MRFNPILGSDLSGHLGGVVGSHNTYGVYFRRRAHPVNPRTANQQTQRTALTFVSQSWRGLDSDQQLAWTTAAITKKSRKGFIVTLTGQGAYMYINTMRQRIGLALLDLPPTGVTPAVLTLPSVSLNSATGIATITYQADDWNAAGGGIIVSVGGPLGPGVSYWQRFTSLGVTPNPGVVAVDYTMPFAVTSGDRVRFRYHTSSPDGRQSDVADQDIVAA
jgi:hypothetical protein